MNYSDKYTEKKLSELEKRLQKIYQQAYSELKAQATEYFESFSARYLKEHNAYMEGKYTYDEFLQWVNNQVARGARWEALRNQMAQRLTDANKLAADYINDTTPKVYAENYNYSAYEIEKGSGISFTLLDEDTVRRLSEREIELLPQASVDIPKDKQWNRQKVQNAVLQGILQGDSVGKLATRLENVASMNRNAAVRNARTMITGAQNGGRQESYSRASAMGIAIEKEWMSANDGRVRDSHMHLNGVRVKYNETFPNGCMYPGDSRGAPCEVYNCRCTMVAITPHADQTKRTGNTAESYKAWKEEKHENGFIEKVAGKLSSTKENKLNYMSNSFRPKYGKETTVKVGKTEMNLQSVDNSSFDMVTDAVSTKDKSVRLTEKMLRKIQKDLPESLEMPKVAVADFKKQGLNVDAIGGYDDTTKTLFINRQYDTRAKILEYVLKEKGRFANQTEYAPYLHELGHKFYYDSIKSIEKANGVSYNEAKKLIDTKIMKYIDGEHIDVGSMLSFYADDGYLSGKYTEVVAEAFSVRTSNELAENIVALVQQ